MKTTVDITDSLLEAARREAQSEGTTLRALIEEGLRKVLAERREPAAFRLRRATFRGEGVDPSIGGWDDIRRRSYEGRGG